MTRQSIAPMKLLTLMVNPLWLVGQQIEDGKPTIINIYHDDWCPCADGDRGLVACTCQEVEYDVSVLEN